MYLFAEMSHNVSSVSASSQSDAVEDSKRSVGTVLVDNTLIQRIQVHWEYLKEGINSRQLRYVSTVKF